MQDFNPTKKFHVTAVKRILRYLIGTTNQGLWFKRRSKFDPIGYCDNDVVGDKVERKNTIGASQFLGKPLVSWTSKKQSIIVLSTSKAKYVLATSCCSQIL